MPVCLFAVLGPGLEGQAYIVALFGKDQARSDPTADT